MFGNMSAKMKTGLYLTAGSLSLAFGVVGIFVPVLPTTPFLLLSSYCYMRSSKRMHAWLTGHPLLGRYIRNYMEHKGITKTHLIRALLFLWLTLGISIYLLDSIHGKLGLAAIGTAVTIHLIRLKRM